MKIEPASSALRTAAYRCDLVALRHLLADGVDPNVEDQWGRTALSLAAEAGHLEVVVFLAVSGALIEPYEEYSKFDSPLTAAASEGHLEIVKKLIELGADPKKHLGPSQATADFYARQNGHVAVHEYLSKVAS